MQSEVHGDPDGIEPAPGAGEAVDCRLALPLNELCL
jgi:hypothetical protein